MTSSADKFDKKMKKLIKADWTAKEVAAVSHRLNKRPFAAKVDYEAVKEEAALKGDKKREELISRVKAASEKEIEGMLFVLEKILQAAKKERPVRRVRRRRVRNW